MAKEATIRNKAKEELVSLGYVVWIPTRNRYGAGVTTWAEDNKAGDDIFNIFDLIGWKENEMLFIQYTSVKDNRSGILARERKIKAFMEKHNVSLPPNCKAEVWGHKDREGFIEIIEI